jgi:hypothetical protein
MPYAKLVLVASPTSNWPRSRFATVVGSRRLEEKILKLKRFASQKAFSGTS